MLSVNIRHIRKNAAEIGSALVLTSIPLGMMAKLILGNMWMGNALMMLALIMMFPVHRLKEGFHFGWLTGCIVFILLSYIYYFFSKFSDPMYLVYMGVVLVFALNLSLLKPQEDIELKKCILWIWIFSFICILCGLYCYITGTVSIFTGMFEYSDAGDRIYDGLTMGSTGITQMTCSLYFLSTLNKKKLELGLFILILIDLIFVFLAFKRTPILVALFILLYYFRKLGYLSFTPKKIIIASCLIIGLVIYVISSPDLSQAIVQMFQDTTEGITNLITGTHTGHGLTNSTDMRLENRQQAFEMIRNRDALQYVLGSGYMTFWFDMPLVQAFLDMGIIGFLLYAYYIVILPVIVLLNKKRNTPELVGVAMLAMYGVLSCLTSGHPYSHGHWEIICLLAFTMNYYDANNKPKIN